MAKTYREYSDERRKSRTPEGVKAGQVFHDAYTVAMALLAARQRAGMTQARVAAMSGIDQADISRIERGQMIPTLATLGRLATALGGEIVIDFGGGERTVIAEEPALNEKTSRTLKVGNLMPRASRVATPRAVAAFRR
jgi:transcriptional regulator with XRE-family HTH domain